MQPEWKIETVGRDLVCPLGRATWFGGDSDPQDNGQTASGFATRGRPWLVACSLPMSGFANVRSTANSPVPKLPWLTVVEVENLKTGQTVYCPVIDIGPSLYTGNAIDLTRAAFRGIGGDIVKGSMDVRFRIIGGATFAAAKMA